MFKCAVCGASTPKTCICGRASASAVSTPQEALDLEEVRRTLEENWVLTPPQAEVLIAEVERLRAALASQPEQEKPWPKA